jgi:2-hydroxy-6-oxo-6-(2'-aminophenyl)hexa-2,4-dienoate hydrolase
MTEQSFEDAYIDAGGVRTHYLCAGSPDLPTAVLIHGGGAGADARGNWRNVIPLLSDAFHVIAYDMPGFGDSDKPDPAAFDYSQGARNRHLAAFVEALGRGPVNLVGNSMGGATSLGLAVERPELVSRLVLMGSAGLNAELSPALMPIVNYDFTPEGMRALIGALTGDGFAIDEELVRYRHERSCDEPTRAAYGAIMHWIKDQGGLFYADDYIRRVQAPTLVVNGKQDLVVPLANAYRFLELIDHSWGYIIPHCGHWAMLEATADFTRETRAFLSA